MPAASNHNWFDTESGILDRRIFADEEIYQEELQKIFGRAWNFMCHESQIPGTGDFFMNWIGEDEVIIVRDGDGGHGGGAGRGAGADGSHRQR